MIIKDSLLCEACLQSYETNPILDGFQKDVIIVENDKCVVFYEKENVIITFTGTNDTKDMLENIRVCKKRTRYGYVHSGFYDSWDDIGDSILEVLYLRNLFGKKIYITGHSLGGAIAMLCAIDFPFKNVIQKVVTFGSPRVGNKDWKNKYNEICQGFKTIRYVNDQDLVSKIPTLFYYHIGVAVYFNNKGNVVKEKPNTFWRIISDKVEGLFDHDLKKYHKALLRNGL